MHKPNSKSQSAMEYLMTYGWAILIIAVVLGALYYLGVFNSNNLAPRAQTGSCKVARPNGPGTTTYISLEGVCTGQLPLFVESFDGSGSGYVTVSNSAYWYSNSLSISVWFQISDWNSRAVVSTYANSRNWMFYRNAAGAPGSLYYLIYYTNTIGGQTNFYQSYANFKLNTWYHVAMTSTFSGSTATAQLYVNGVLQSTTTVSDFQSWYLDTTRPVRIGISPGGSWPFYGLISNLQIYNTTLSSSEIQGLYAEGIGGAPIPSPSLTGWWPLNGDSNDYSGNGNNGAATSVVFTSTWSK